MAEAVVQVSKYPRTPHLPFSPGVQSDDIVLKSEHTQSLKFLSQESILTEKLDGGNCSIFRGKVYARSVNSEATHPSFGPIKQLAQEFSYAISPSMQLFGENMFGIHSIEYDRLESYFYLFAVLEHGSWWSWDRVAELADEISVPTVPIAVIKSFADFEDLKSEITSRMKQPSHCGTCSPEGFVVRTREGFTAEGFEHHVAKFVREGHVQTDETWRRTWKQAKIRKS